MQQQKQLRWGYGRRAGWWKLNSRVFGSYLWLLWLFSNKFLHCLPMWNGKLDRPTTIDEGKLFRGCFKGCRPKHPKSQFLISSSRHMLSCASLSGFLLQNCSFKFCFSVHTWHYTSLKSAYLGDENKTLTSLSLLLHVVSRIEKSSCTASGIASKLLLCALCSVSVIVFPSHQERWLWR